MMVKFIDRCICPFCKGIVQADSVQEEILHSQPPCSICGTEHTDYACRQALHATNATLRAEVQKYESVANPARVAIEAMAERDALRAQLAAEREKSAGLEREMKDAKARMWEAGHAADGRRRPGRGEGEQVMRCVAHDVEDCLLCMYNAGIDEGLKRGLASRDAEVARLRAHMSDVRQALRTRKAYGDDMTLTAITNIVADASDALAPEPEGSGK